MAKPKKGGKADKETVKVEGTTESKLPPTNPAWARTAADMRVPADSKGLAPVYAAVFTTFQYDGRFYDVPAHTVGMVPKPVCPHGGNVRRVRALYADDGVNGLDPERRYELNLKLVAEAEVEAEE